MASTVTREDSRIWIRPNRYFTLSVSFLVSVSVLDTANVCHQQNIASKGGQMSGRNQQQEEEEEEDEDDFQGFADTGERERFRYGYTSSDLSHPVE